MTGVFPKGSAQKQARALADKIDAAALHAEQHGPASAEAVARMLNELEEDWAAKDRQRLVDRKRRYGSSDRVTTWHRSI